MTHYLVVEWMTPFPITVSPQTLMVVAYQLMTRHHIHHLPVVKHNQLVGIVTSNDLREATSTLSTTCAPFALNDVLSKVSVDTVMKRNVITVAPKSTLQDAARLMLHEKISVLPVLDGDKLLGIITQSDIFCRLVRDMRDISQQ